MLKKYKKNCFCLFLFPAPKLTLVVRKERLTQQAATMPAGVWGGVVCMLDDLGSLSAPQFSGVTGSGGTAAYFVEVFWGEGRASLVMGRMNCCVRVFSQPPST